jgi:hypothetical protein
LFDLLYALSNIYFDLIKKKKKKKSIPTKRCFVSPLIRHFRRYCITSMHTHTRTRARQWKGRERERERWKILWHYQNYYCYSTSLGIMRKRINRVVILRRAKCVYSSEKFLSTNDVPPVYYNVILYVYIYIYIYIWNTCAYVYVCMFQYICYGICSVQ